jgi:hypothetical protein
VPRGSRTTAAALGVAALLLASCSGGAHDTAGQAAPSPTSESHHAAPPERQHGAGGHYGAGGEGEADPSPKDRLLTEDEAAPPGWAGLDAYRQRCRDLDLRGAKARVLYEARKEMTRGDSASITAAVTLDKSIPRQEVLHRRDDLTAEEPGLVVSCRIDARLRASHYQFEVSGRGWVARSLLTTNTARWSWYVTPKLGGTHTILLDLRPILLLHDTETGSATAETANVQQYETSVHVSVPWTERPQETMSRIAATFKVAEALVKAITLLVVALVALGAALGIRGRKKTRATA